MPAFFYPDIDCGGKQSRKAVYSEQTFKRLYLDHLTGFHGAGL